MCSKHQQVGGKGEHWKSLEMIFLIVFGGSIHASLLNDKITIPINITNSPQFHISFCFSIIQQGMPMRPQAMASGQAGMMGMVAPASNTTPYMIQPQTNSLPTEHQNGNSKNIQLDPFGAFWIRQTPSTQCLGYKFNVFFFSFWL